MYPMTSNLLSPIALVLFAGLLGSCRMGAPESMLTEQSFMEAVMTLQKMIGQRTRAFRIDIDDADFTLLNAGSGGPNAYRRLDALSLYVQQSI